MPNILRPLPGLLAGLALALLALLLSGGITNLFSLEQNPLSPILLALLMGIILRSTAGLPSALEPGVAFGLKRLLRLGIILMGIRLSLFSVLKIGAAAVSLVLLCILAAFFVTIFIARRMGVSERLGILIAAGTSICGVSAIVATGPAIDAREEESAYAISSITLFGMLATLAYPYLSELVLHLPVSHAGFFLGTAVHDTSQVTASSLIYDQLWQHRSPGGLGAADIAITTKLVRNTFLALMIPLISLYHTRRDGMQRPDARGGILQHVPLFVLGYLAMGALRSAGDFAFGSDLPAWVSTWHFLKTAATWVLMVSIGCIGLNTDIRRLSNLGARPLICGFVAAGVVGLFSLLLISRFGSWMDF